MRTALLIGFCLAVLGLSLLLRTGGRSEEATFFAGKFQVNYVLKAKGKLGPLKLKYVLISSEGAIQEIARESSDSITQIERDYLDGARTNLVSFAVRNGDTVWIGPDRKPVVCEERILIEDLALIEQNAVLFRNASSAREFFDILHQLRMASESGRGVARGKRHT